MRGARRFVFGIGMAAFIAVVAGALMASPAGAATFVYVGNAESNEVYVLQLGRQNGDLTVVEKAPIPGIEKPGISTPMSVSPDRRFLYVGTRREPQVAAGFAIAPSTGKLTPTASPAAEARPKAGPRHFVYHPGGKLVYVIGELDGNVYVFDYNAASGDLTQKQVVSALPAGFQGKASAADLHITPDGKFLYGSERTTSTLAGFQVDPAKGTLTPIGSVPTEKQPRGFGIDPAGRYLLAVGQLSHGLSSYSIDQTSGKLTK